MQKRKKRKKRKKNAQKRNIKSKRFFLKKQIETK
jgi:hypothetical protein